MNPHSVEYLFGPLSSIGLAGPVLDIYSKFSGRYVALEEIDPAIRRFELPESEVKGEVIIPFMHSQATTDHLLSVMAHAFKVRGYRPIVVSCRGTLADCFRKIKHPDTEGTCVNCRHKTDAILDAYGLEQTSLDEYLSTQFYMQLPSLDDELRSVTYRGVDVSRYALASTRRHLKKFHIDLTDDGDRIAYLGNLQAAMQLAEFTHNLIDAHDVVATVGHHPAYNYSGALLATTASRGVPAISYAGGYLRKGTVIFGNEKNRKGFTLFTDHNTLQTALKEPLTDDKRAEAQKYMKGRQEGTTIKRMNNYTADTSGGAAVDSSQTVVGLFTNLVWDGSLSDCAITFDTPFEWVKETIEYVDCLSDVHVILKPHPAEAHRETNEEMRPWVEEHVEVPENVTLLPADTDVSPYDLMEDLDVGIVFNSTVGLEMVYNGVPVISTGDTHYRNLGFTHDPETPKEYFRLLDSINEITLTEYEKELAERYAYFLLVERHLPIQKIESVSDIHTLTHEDICENDTFDHIVERVLANDRAITCPKSSRTSIRS